MIMNEKCNRKVEWVIMYQAASMQVAVRFEMAPKGTISLVSAAHTLDPGAYNRGSVLRPVLCEYFLRAC